MSIQVQLRKGTSAQNSAFTGQSGELIYTTDTKELFIHDGVTAGGTNVAASVADDSVTFAKIEKIADQTILGNNSGGSSDILELTPAQVRAIINVADGATANDSDANLKNRANHTGTQLSSTISDFQSAVSLNANVVANTAKVSASGSVTTHNDVTSAGSGAIITSTERTKLSGITEGATANSSDATLLARANHTGTQTASTISDFDTEVANNSAVVLNTAKNSYPSADATKVGFISVTQAVNLDTMESNIATNNAKVTNATHTGEVTGSTALTIANGVVDSDNLSTTLDFGSIA